MERWPIAAARTKSFVERKSGTSKTIPEFNARQALEMAEARELLATYRFTQKKVMTSERMEFIERRYGAGSVKRIINYMSLMDKGELD